MNIGDAAKIVDLPVKTVRYYADIGLVSPALRSSAGYRLYDRQTLEQLVLARRARALGFSIDDCRALLNLFSNTHRTAREVKILANRRLQEIRNKQHELQTLHDELAALIKICHGDERPDCPILDGLAKPQHTP